MHDYFSIKHNLFIFSGAFNPQVLFETVETQLRIHKHVGIYHFYIPSIRHYLIRHLYAIHKFLYREQNIFYKITK